MVPDTPLFPNYFDRQKNVCFLIKSVSGTIAAAVLKGLLAAMI